MLQLKKLGIEDLVHFDFHYYFYYYSYYSYYYFGLLNKKLIDKWPGGKTFLFLGFGQNHSRMLV